MAALAASTDGAAMTDADRAALKAMVERWRTDDWRSRRDCADELDALIAAGLSEAPAPQEKELDARAQGDAMAVDFLKKFPDARADRNHLGAWFHSAMQVGAEMVEADDAWEEWQPIEDAPKDGRWFLCFGALWTLPALGQWSRTANCFQSMDGALWKLTHWMPLPDPPALASPAPPKEQA